MQESEPLPALSLQDSSIQTRPSQWRGPCCYLFVLTAFLCTPFGFLCSTTSLVVSELLVAAKLGKIPPPPNRCGDPSSPPARLSPQNPPSIQFGSPSFPYASSLNYSLFDCFIPIPTPPFFFASVTLANRRDLLHFPLFVFPPRPPAAHGMLHALQQRLWWFGTSA